MTYIYVSTHLNPSSQIKAKPKTPIRTTNSFSIMSMTKKSTSISPLKTILSLLVLSITITSASRILDEEAVAPPAAATAAAGPAGALTFFMHDIIGGSNPTALAVTGVVSNPALSGQLPFAKPNGAVLPVNNGVEQNNNNNGIINNNNLPFLTGLGGPSSANLVQNNNGNNNNNQLVSGASGFSANGQLPSGSTLEKLMFGTMTVIDDELTEGHELGSGLVGKAQGFYVSSSVDGRSQTMAFTAMFQGGGYVDSLSFFGVHRTASAESHLAVMGGTGKYVNAKGFALVKTFPATNQHNGDGVETLLEFTVYLA